MNIFKTICAGLLLAALNVHAGDPDRLSGDWHGTVETPQGELMLIFAFAEDNGTLGGELEVPAQAPGTKIPLRDIRIGEGSLSFTIPSIAASFSGSWDDNEARWDGVFNQQIDLPLTLAPGMPASAPVIDGMDGTWEGLLQRNGVALRLVLRVETGKHGTIARLDSPDQGGFNIPVFDFNRDGDAVSFEVPVASVRFEGLLDENESEFAGEWARTGQPPVEVSFTRTDSTTARAEPERPQMPKEPFPYEAEEVTFDNPDAGDVTLAGTLTLPPGDGPFPVAVLISGSGPQDRDETVFGHKPFAVIADHLTRHGVAVLRYDDRGVGASSGDHGTATSADFATDANAAANYLLRRPEIDREAIGFIGHSEGGMIAPIATLDNDRIAFIVLLAGPGTSTLQLMESQLRLLGLSQGMSEAELDRRAPLIAEINQAILASNGRGEAGERVRALLTPEALETLGMSVAHRDLAVSDFTRDWYRYFLQYDAAAVLSRINVPMLALNGSLDHQVPADENLEAIEAATRHNPDASIQKLEGLNHMFQTAPTGALGEYPDIAETFAPEALRIISEWINERFSQ